MSYGKYGMKNIGVNGNNFTNIAYQDPWFAAGMLAAQAWNKNYNDRGQKKADADVDAELKAKADDISAAEGQYGSGVVGLTPKELIVQGKTDYATAQAANDTKGMQNAQNMAAMGRNIGAANGINLNGYGANDSLESIFNMQAQKGGYSPEAKTENIGQGLYTQQPEGEGVLMSTLNRMFPPKPKEEPRGVFNSGTLEKFASPRVKEEPSKGVFAAWEEKYGSPQKEEEPPKGVLTDGFAKGMAALERSRKTPMDILNEVENERKITLADFSKVTGIDYEAKAREDAQARAKARMLDPNFVGNMETMLRRKGYTDEQVETAMGRVREQAKNAQTEDLTNKFMASQANGDYLGAMQHISRLSEINPVAAQTLGVSSPTFKNMWDVNNTRQDAATAQEYRKENMGLTHKYSEDTAENNVARRLKVTQATEEIRRQSQKMSREDAFDFAFDKYYEATGDKKEAARLAAGIKGGSSAQQEAIMKRVDATIKAGRKWLEDNPGSKIEDYPGYENYKVAEAMDNQYWSSFKNGGNGGGSTGAGGDSGKGSIIKSDGVNWQNEQVNDYNTAIKEWDELLHRNASSTNKLSRAKMEEIARIRYGEMANNIITYTEWDKFGFGNKKSPQVNFNEYEPSGD